jgi:flagellar assembly factor FliW
MMLALDTREAMADVEDIPVIEFIEPVHGFPQDRHFALVRLEEGSALSALRSLERDDLRFLVVPMVLFYPELTPEVSDEVVASLGVDSADDVLVLLIVHAGDSLEETTVNLRGPLLINTVTRRAVQVVLDDPDLSVTAPLFRG